MHHYKSATMTELHEKLIDGLLYATPDDLDLVSSVDVSQHLVIAEADSMEWDFDLKTSWLTKSRWSMMVRQYLDPQDLETWIGRITAKIGLKERGMAVMRTKTVKPRGGEATGHTNKETRIWGACMLSFTYKAKPQPTLTMHSRTSYLGYIGALDLTVAYMLGKYLARELGIPVSKMKFVWINEATQWHFFKSISFVLTNPDKERSELFRKLILAPSAELTREQKLLVLEHPAIRGSRKWFQKVVAEDAAGRTYGALTYNTFRRVIRRFHTEVYGEEYASQFRGWEYYKRGPMAGKEKEFFEAYPPLPSVNVNELDFSAIGMPANRRYGEPFVGGDDEDEDD